MMTNRHTVRQNEIGVSYSITQLEKGEVPFLDSLNSSIGIFH